VGIVPVLRGLVVVAAVAGFVGSGSLPAAEMQRVAAIGSAPTVVSVSGTITDRDGNGIPGQAVALTSPTGDGSDTTAVDGSFQIIVPAGSYTLVITGRGGSSSAVPGPYHLQSLDPVDASADLTLNMQFPNRYADVTVSGGGAAVAAAQVSLDGGGTQFTAGPGLVLTGFDGSTSGLTDATGKVTLPFFPTQNTGTQLRVTPPAGSGFVPSSTTIPDMTVDHTVSVSLRSASGSTLDGTLVDSNGTPLAGAYVYLSEPGVGFAGQTATDATGYYSISVAPGSYNVFFGGATGPPDARGGTMGWSMSSTSSVDLTGDAHLDLTVPLQTVDLSVVNSVGAPVEGVTAILSSRPSGTLTAGGLTFRTTTTAENATPVTDASGAVSLRLLPTSDTVSIRITPPSGSGLAPVTTTLPGVTSAVAQTVVLPAGIGFSGTVTDGTGNPFGAQRITLQDSGGQVTTWTASDGSYSMLVAPGSYTVEVVGGGQDVPSYDVTSASPITVDAATTQDFTLPGYTMDTRVQTPAGVGISGAAVTLRSNISNYQVDTSFDIAPGVLVSGHFDTNAAVISDANGHVRFRIMPFAQQAQLHAAPPPNTNFTTGLTTVGPVSSDATASITLYSLTGNIDSASGTPLAGQIISLTTAPLTSGVRTSPNWGSAATTTITRQTRTTKAGFYGLVVPRGRFTLGIRGTNQAGRAIPSSYTLTAPPIDMTVGRQLNLQLPIVLLRMKVISASGAPILGALVQVPCAPTSATIAAGLTATGSVCGQATTPSTGAVPVALLPVTGAIITVTPPSSLLCPRTLTNQSITATRILRVVLTAAPCTA
jgi:hypothetical protein